MTRVVGVRIKTGKGGVSSGSDGRYAVLWRGCEVGPVSPEVGDVSLLGESSVPGLAGRSPTALGSGQTGNGEKGTDHIGSPFLKVFVK